ncbi:MAG: hypothetical protein EP318_15520 [Rhodobacteraceae bacterium]|nr:MAG: hypothetical protein EP318_15520 [Paracoccaceae bacterium]
MSGCIVQVWFEVDSEHRSKRAPFRIIETELPDFQAFCQMVEADRLIGGDILWTRRTEGGVQEIVRRVPCAFRGQAVIRCELPTWRFQEGSA